MKVAVCVSGAFRTGNPRGDLERNNAIQKARFPDADFYYATWDGFKPEFERLFPNERCEYLQEPVMHYHPYIDIRREDHISKFYQETVDWVKKGGAKRIEWTSHHTKQILIHSWLLNKIEAEYDVIVRTRFDGFISENADFYCYLKDTHDNKRANCFGATKKQGFDKLNEFDTSSSRHSNWMLDQLIIHNVIDDVDSLHREKRLHAAEYGWYQAISMNHGSNHRNHDGWVNHDKNVLDDFLMKGA